MDIRQRHIIQTVFDKTGLEQYTKYLKKASKTTARVFGNKIPKDAIIIPYQAIIITSDRYEVYVVDSFNRVKKRKVILSQREDENVIVQSGIKAGDRVVLEGQINLVDGSKVFEIKK